MHGFVSSRLPTLGSPNSEQAFYYLANSIDVRAQLTEAYFRGVIFHLFLKDVSDLQQRVQIVVDAFCKGP